MDKKHFVLLHGFTGTPDGNFFPWLAKELQGRGYTIDAPFLPNTNNPDILEQALFALKNVTLNENTIVVAHSLGCPVALKMLESAPVPIKKTILAAGFMEPGFKDRVRPFEATFDWEFDDETIKHNAGSLVYLRSSTDSAVPEERADTMQKRLGGRIVDVTSEDDHFCGEQEPSILAECLTD